MYNVRGESRDVNRMDDVTSSLACSMALNADKL
jgi:hypothetical protein